MKRALKLFEACRKDLPEDVELLHDVHERVHPIQAVRFAKDVEQFRLFFLEDVLSPEDMDYFKLIRQQSATQLAMGELFDNPHEWIPLISGRLIDFIRIHPSMIGGLTPARKVAALAEAFNVRSAWHGPGDLSPIGACCNITLDVTISELRSARAYAFPGTRTGSVSGLPGGEERLLVSERRPGLGYRGERDCGGQISVRQLRKRRA